MTRLSVKKLFLFIFLTSLVIGSCNAQLFHKDPEKELFGKTRGITKEAKIREPKSVVKAKRKQETNDRRLKRKYEKSVKQSQKRTFDIQSPDVKARMKQNKKDYSKRDREKKKKIRSGTKRAGEKYK